MNFRTSILALCGVLSGCATVNPMAFDRTATAVDVRAKSVVLMTLDVSRSDESRYVPRPLVVYFEKPNATDKAGRQNFKIDGDADMIKTAGGRDVYVLRMALEPGPYQVKGIFGKASAFPFNGFFFVPLLMDIEVPKAAVTYAGRVKAELRPRQGNEFRAGSVIPLLDQSATGISGGTFDVSLEDASQEDIGIFKANFPALSETAITTTLLPPFDRPKAQRWWEGENAASASP
jgi:hypothetical protein